MSENTHKTHNDFSSKFLESVNSLKEESDRGCIIVAAAWIDDDLKTKISSFLLTKAEKNDELLHETNALGNFSDRIDVAYRLGLIQKDTRKVLHILRKMRNDSAHKRVINSFDKPAIKNRTIDIARGVEEILEDMWNALLKFFPEYLENNDYNNKAQASTNIRNILGTRQLFIWAVSCIITGFALVREDIVPISVRVKKY